MVQTRSQTRLARGSHLLRLPNELFAKISDNLDVPSLARLTRTNRELHGALDETLYRKRGHRHLVHKKVAIKRGSYGYRSPLADQAGLRANRRRRYYNSPLSPLEWATIKNRVTTIKKFIGYRPIQPEVFWFLHPGNALELSAMAGHAGACREILDSANMPVPRRGRWDCYPAHMAAYCDHPEVIRAFIESGAPIDKYDAQGMTALDVAAHIENTASIEMLLRIGAAKEAMLPEYAAKLDYLLAEDSETE